MIIPEQFRVINNQSVRVTFGLEIRVEMFHLEWRYDNFTR